MTLYVTISMGALLRRHRVLSKQRKLTGMLSVFVKLFMVSHTSFQPDQRIRWDGPYISGRLL